MLLKRIIANLLLLIAVLFAPWWVTALFGAALLFVFPMFLEVVVAGALLDLLYGVGDLYFTAGALVLYAAAMGVRRSIRYYE